MKLTNAAQTVWTLAAFVIAVVALIVAGVALSRTSQAPVPAQQAAKASQAPQVQVDFRLAQTKKAKGLKSLKLPNEVLWYLPKSVLTRAQLVSVTPQSNQAGKAYVQFTFSKQGAKRLAQLSQRYAGKLLIVTINDSFIGIIKMNNPISDGVLSVGMGSSQEAIKVAKLVAGKQ